MKITYKHRKKLKFYLDRFYNSFPGEKFTIFHFVRFFKLRLKNNKDAWVGVSGDTGTGKSLFALMSMILFGRPMDMEKNVAYIPKGDEIIKKFSKIDFGCLLIDEAARQMRKVNWQSKEQQMVNLTAMTDRFKNNMVFLNLPNFSEFTKSMRNGSIIFRVIIPYRTDLYARVIVQRKSRNWRSDDPWGDDLANKRYAAMEKKKGSIANDDIETIERAIPNTVMDFIVPNLELILPEVTGEYEKLKMESRGEVVEEATNPKTNKFKTQYENMMNIMTKIIFNNELDLGKRRVTKSEMASSLGIAQSTFNKFLNLPRVEDPLKKKKPRDNISQ
jgi:hypothetical protein